MIETLLEARSATARANALAAERGHTLQRQDRINRQFRQAERMANFGSWRLTLADNRTEWSEQTYAIHGLPPGSGTPLDTALDFYPPHARPVIADAVARTMATGEPFSVETDFRTAQGEYRRVQAIGEIELENGVPVALIGVFHDVTERYALEQALRDAAAIDELTRLATRARFNEVADARIAAAKAHNTPLALLLIDLDHFKLVNDSCGHPAGDEVLRCVAECLQSPALADSFAARLGGDEFVVLVDSPQLLRDLPGFLRRLLAELCQTVGSDHNDIGVSATIGAGWLDAGVTNRSDLLHRVDKALYQAKRARRGSAVIFGQFDLITAAPVAGKLSIVH